MRKSIAIIISLVFLGYGLIRIGVGSALLGQETGVIDVEAFRDPIHDVGKFLAKSQDKQIIPLSVAEYVAYIALMGFVLSIGAIRTLNNLKNGFAFIGAFIAMYALLFINFQTINPKAIHLGICMLLFGALIWLKGHRSQAS